MRKLLLLSLVLAASAAGLLSPSPASGVPPSGDCVTYCATDPCGYTCCYRQCCGKLCVDLSCAPPPPCEASN